MEIFVYFLTFLIIVILVFLSLRERTKVRTTRNYLSDLPDLKSSPFSEALASLIGTAGGIYLTLIMLTTFLEVPVPEKVTFIGIYIEPLAGVSVFLAIIQPYVLKLYQKIKYRI